MKEKDALNKIMLEAPDSRTLFRQNTGQAWAGEVIEKGANFIVLKSPRPFNAGLCKGSGDLIGWESVKITPEMVGKTVAVFVSVEVKTGRLKLTEDQRNFFDQVKASGGIAEVVRADDNLNLKLEMK